MERVYRFLNEANQHINTLFNYFVYVKDGENYKFELATPSFAYTDAEYYNLFSLQIEKLQRDFESRGTKNTKEFADYLIQIVENRLCEVDEVQRKMIATHIINDSSLFFTINGNIFIDIREKHWDSIFDELDIMAEDFSYIRFYTDTIEYFIDKIITLFEAGNINLYDILKKCLGNGISELTNHFNVNKGNEVVKEVESDDVNVRCELTVRERLIALKYMINYIYLGFKELSDTDQMIFINNITGINGKATTIKNGSMYKPYKDIKKMETGINLKDAEVESYNKSIDKISALYEKAGIEKLSKEIKKKKITNN